MRKLSTLIVAAAVLVTAVHAAEETPTASSSISGPTTFDLKYRGLSAPDDPLSYRSYWGFGSGREADTAFIVAVKKRVEKYDLVYNPMLPEDARWSLVELKDGKPVAFYLDADANGKLSDSERFLPAAPLGSNFGYECAFITSDFMIHTKEQQEIPFRIMLVAYRRGPDEISYMWSPCCVLEGQAMLAGEPTKLFMYADGFGGSFTTFRRCSLALIPADRKIEGYLPRESLSSLIYYQDTFYRLKLVGAHGKDKTLTVVLEKDTTPTGKVEVELTGPESMKGRLTSARIEGTKDESIYLNVGGGRATFPAGAYRLASGYVTYGTKDDNEWRVNFSNGPAFDITAEDTSKIKLGELGLSVSAVVEKDRNRSDVQAQSTFAKGTAIYISPQIVGKAGEAYMRFGKQGSQANRFTDVKPHLAIVDSDGKEIAAADLEYG